MDAIRPIFVLSLPRSGSTLLQRLVMSSGKALIWGEPYPRMGYVRQLSKSLQALSGGWPPDRWILDPASDGSQPDLWQSWVANLMPPPAQLVEAHRAFLRQLYAPPASAGPGMRWGFKEVRYGMEQARYLHWLFPKAQFLFLHRSPYEAYRSYRSWHLGSYESWPDRPIWTPDAFGQMWRRLAQGFVQEGEAMGGMVVAYDGLTTDAGATSRIGGYLGLELDAAALALRIDGRQEGSEPLAPVPAGELRSLRRAVEPLAGSLGYRPE